MQRRLAYENLSCRYVTMGTEQPVEALFYQWVGCRDDAGLILEVGRFREDQSICVETRENVILIIWDL